jgi:hypothetical protein
MNNFEPHFVIRGDKVKASYRHPEIPEYYDNPMIESLPPIWSEDEATEEISFYPPYHEAMRNSPDHIRHHLIQNSLRFFSPLDIHIDLERRFSCLMRVGYTDRNPFKGEFWKDVNQRINLIEKSSRNQYTRNRKYHSTSASGFSVVGISGIGKSQTIEQILRIYPQVIYHIEYQKKNFTYTQLVWLKLDCPFDGSIRGLCYNFFQTIDDLLGTNYFAEFAENARSVDEMIPNMARVAANHCIGVLVIDEIQRLSKAKSGGAEAMLDFFVQLVNTIGIPVVLVGTYKALPILSGAVSQMRRGTGQGDLVWDRMQYDEQWQLLMEDLWDYQYIKNKCSLENSSHLSKVLYEESQGITDLAIKLFMFSQERAITSGEEEITSSIIRSAAKDKFNLLQPALKAFKDKDKEALSNFEDAYPEFLKVILLEKSDQPEIIGIVVDEPEIKTLLNSETESKFETESNNETYLQNEKQLLETQMAIENFFQSKISKTGNLPKKQEAQGILPSIFKSIESPNSKKIYDALKKADFIQSGTEFLSDKEVRL